MMNNELPFVITISRQLGSGGSYIGQQLASRLNIMYLDREILYRAAQDLKISETELHSREERVTPRWQAWMESLAHVYPEYAPPKIDIPMDQLLFEAESGVIKRVAEEQSAVIVGRAGSYLLRNFPRHLSVFLHADLAFRQRRVQDTYHVSGLEALKLINRIDRERMQYLRTFTGLDCLNACQYHLSLDTSNIGINRAEDIILATLQVRLGDIKIQGEKSAAV